MTFPRVVNEIHKDCQNTPIFKQNQNETSQKLLGLQLNTNKFVQNKMIALNSAENLKYSHLHGSMNILGRIYQITDYYILIALPGQINGKLNVSNISETYTNLLKNITIQKESSNEFKLLSDLYKEGDYLICCVKDLNSRCREILLSTEPHLINQNFNLNNLKKFSKIIACIKSIEDHGYVLETGLKNLKAFLPFNKVTNENSLFIGKQIVCAITDIKNIENTFIAKVSALFNDLDITETRILSFSYLFPTIKCFLVVEKILHNGLQVGYDENKIGYINHQFIQKPLSSFKLGQDIVGTLLYVIPTIKIAFFSLLSLEQEKNSLSIGDVITEAKVLSYDSKGLLVKLNKCNQGYIPLKRAEVHFDNINSTFMVDSLLKCKIIAYNSLSKLYICSMDANIMTKQSITEGNLRPGDKTEITIVDISKKNKSVTVSCGKNIGIVPYHHVSDPEVPIKLTVGQCVASRVLETSNKLIFTLKKSLVESKFPILFKIEDAKIGLVYDATVFKILNQGIVVHFFGNLKGWIPNRFINLQSPSQKFNVLLGQTIAVKVKSIDVEKEKILLTPINSNKKSKAVTLNIGDIVEGTVIDSSVDGLYMRLKIKEEDKIAFLPAGHMSPCQEIGKLLAAKTIAGYKLSAIVFSIKPNLILSTTFAPKESYKIDNLNVGDLVMCSVKSINQNGLSVIVPTEKYLKSCKIITKNIDYLECIHKYQILFGKILDINKKTREIYLTTQLSKVWNNFNIRDLKIMTAIDVLSSYLSKVFELSNNIYYTSKFISKLHIGQHIIGTVETAMDNGLILKLDKDLKGIVQKSHYSKNYKPGDKVKGSILWINYPQECVEISLLPHIINSVDTKQTELFKIPMGIQLRGEIVLINDWFILILLKGQGKGTLVTLPSRRHLNDTKPDLTPYRIGGKVRCYGILNKEDRNILMPVCILKSAFESQNRSNEKIVNFSPEHLKRKLQFENNNILSVKKIKICDEEEIFNYKDEKNDRNTQKINETSNIVKNFSKLRKDEFAIETKQCLTEIDTCKIVDSCNSQEITSTKNECLASVIPECGFKWETKENRQNKETDDSSSYSEEENKVGLKSKKKKVKHAEKKEFERKKERGIYEQEITLVSHYKPQSTDEFDKLVLTNPNSSIIWIQYMAYYVQATEIDKARAVARRALQTINFREEIEKLNVWQAWLNLESRFGSSESLDIVFRDAIKTSDAKNIYEHMLIVHTEAGRYSDVEKIVNLMTAKFKYDLEVWITCVTVLSKIGVVDKARHVMQRSYQSLPKIKHVELMVKFAQIENNFGSKEQAYTLFEEILSSYPKRTDVLSIYVDLLVKVRNIDKARKVFDRALSTTIPDRKIKIILKKYINLEETYGTPENISRIKRLALNYIEDQCRKIDNN